jgi:GntR family transcriptional regulator
MIAARKLQKRKAPAQLAKSYLYRDVASVLRQRIRESEYPANTKLPGFHELVAEFKVSGITIRRALQELSYEGLISGEQGRGVFVKSKNVIHRVFAGYTERSIGDEISRAGFKPSIREISYDRCKADVETAVRLSIAPGSKVRRHRKLVFADKEPVSLHILQFTDFVAKRIEARLAQEFFFGLLHRAHIAYDDVKLEFTAAALSSEHSELFHLPAGFPMSLVYYTPLAANKKPIFTGLTISRSDRFIFELNLPAKSIKSSRPKDMEPAAFEPLKIPGS